jgi:drug/metabolite transporter (DMT)-like permease
MLIGVLLVIAACFCWGINVVVPQFLMHFNPIEVAMSRFIFFGLISFLILLAKKRHLLEKRFLKPWFKSIQLTFFATIFGYSCTVFGIQYANSAVTALIVGLSPITIALFANLSKREFSYSKFIFPALLMILGIVLVNLSAFSNSEKALNLYLLGLLFAFVSLSCWTLYTIGNHRYLSKNKEMAPTDWVIMMGVSSLILSILAGVVLFFFTDLAKFHPKNPHFHHFLLGGFLLGAMSSWVGFLLWNYGNKRLPISLAGQLTIFEMIFGLSFTYIVQKKIPLPLEITGIVIILTGVLLAFKKLKKLSPPPNENNAAPNPVSDSNPIKEE